MTTGILIKGGQRAISHTRTNAHTQKKSQFEDETDVKELALKIAVRSKAKNAVATRSWKRKGFSPRASEGGATLLTPCFQPSDTDFGFLASKIVRG